MRMFAKRNVFIFKKIKLKRVLAGFLIMSLGLGIASFWIFTDYLSPTILSLAAAQAKYMGEKAVNDAVSQRLAEEQLSYNELVELVTDNDGKITAIKTNMMRMNIIKSQIANMALDKIYELEKIDVSVPLFNAFGNSFLSGRGPMVPIKMIPVGSVEASFLNDFKTAGINQTRHEISLQVKCRVSVVMSTGSAEAELLTNVPIAQTVIVGIVPGSYTNVEGVEDSPQDAILNLIE